MSSVSGSGISRLKRPGGASLVAYGNYSVGDHLAALASSDDVAAGAVLAGFKPSFAGAVGRSVGAKLHDSVSVKDFGAVGDGVADDTDALQRARDYIANPLVLNKGLVFPSGDYKYSLSPNWAIRGARIIADGKVTLTYTGTGHAVVIDSGPDALDLTYGMMMTYFIVRAPATAGYGVYVRSVHHSHLGFAVRGCGAGLPGVRVEFAVVTVFERPTVSVNVEGWYQGAKPGEGLHLTERDTNAGVNEKCSYCEIFDPIIEGTSVGITLGASLGNKFWGGTSEACSDAGVNILASATENRFFGTDFEANGSYDVHCVGSNNEIYACDSEKAIIFGAGAARNTVFGGSHNDIRIDAGAVDTRMIGAKYNRFGTGSLVDNGARSRFSDCLNIATALHHNALPVRKVIALGASPFTYTNTTAQTEMISVSGGGVSYLGIERGGVGNSVGASSGIVPLAPGDRMTIIYAAPPVVTGYPL